MKRNYEWVGVLLVGVVAVIGSCVVLSALASLIRDALGVY